MCGTHYAFMRRHGTLPPKNPVIDGCSVADCERSHMALGLCKLHYDRFKKTGSTDLPKRPSPEERFWSKVERAGPDDCWHWTASHNQRGYGTFWSGKQPTSAHRFAYELAHGPVPEGLTVDHLCNNPPCVNPAHLRTVTFAENNLASSSPSALNARKTHCPRGHPYDEENTLLMRGRRYCATCHNNPWS